NPEIVEELPVAKQFDQIGPYEFGRYGKLRIIEFLLKPDGGVTIPYTIYLDNNSPITGTLSVTDGVMLAYTILVSKTTAGRVLRIELGPTGFKFHRLSCRLQLTQSGKDSDMEWIEL